MVIKSTSLETNLAKNTFDEMNWWVIIIYVKIIIKFILKLLLSKDCYIKVFIPTWIILW